MNPPMVYLVDDDAAVRKSLMLSLEQRGLAVRAFDSAEAFLDTGPYTRPGCLVLDIQMPGIDGLELQRRLLEIACGIPIIFITGHGDIPMSVKAMKMGALDFLEKPVRHDALVKSIQRALARDTIANERELEKTAILERYARLTPREKEIMSLLVCNLGNITNKQIADKLAISYRTVDHHRSRVMEKMAAQSLSHLVAMDREFRLTDIAEAPAQ